MGQEQTCSNFCGEKVNEIYSLKGGRNTVHESTENHHLYGNHKAITLIGTDQIPTYTFTVENIYKLVRVQANIRRFLAQ